MSSTNQDLQNRKKSGISENGTGFPISFPNDPIVSYLFDSPYIPRIDSVAMLQLSIWLTKYTYVCFFTSTTPVQLLHIETRTTYK